MTAALHRRGGTHNPCSSNPGGRNPHPPRCRFAQEHHRDHAQESPTTDQKTWVSRNFGDVAAIIGAIPPPRFRQRRDRPQPTQPGWRNGFDEPGPVSRDAGRCEEASRSPGKSVRRGWCLREEPGSTMSPAKARGRQARPIRRRCGNGKLADEAAPTHRRHDDPIVQPSCDDDHIARTGSITKMRSWRPESQDRNSHVDVDARLQVSRGSGHVAFHGRAGIVAARAGP